jgi:hypothetical protein
MLYTFTHPADQRDRILLYPSIAAARAAAGDDGSIRGLAVRFDTMGRRLAPLWTDPRSLDPRWTTAAYADGDGTIIARGPIPECLFVG